VLGLLRLYDKAFEAVTLENLESVVGADEIEPCPGGLRVGGARDHGGTVVRERVDLRRDIDVPDRIADLFLEDRL
jgi:hypothetical protein